MAERDGVRVMIVVKVSIFCDAAIINQFNDFGAPLMPPLFTAVCTVPFVNTGVIR